MGMSIYSFTQNPEALLNLEPEMIAGYVLEFLHLQDAVRKPYSRYNFSLPYTVQAYPPEYREKVGRVLMESWGWLERQGYLASQGQDGWFVISRIGENLKTAEQFHASLGKQSVQVIRKTETPMQSHTIDIFISHSSRDKEVASALIELLQASCNIPHDKIRCTSVEGYRLPLGASTDQQLRTEVREARLFIGLITPSSMQSAYVLFELGARWGAELPLAPVLACGADASLLGGPLAGFNALNCSIEDQMHQLVHDIGLVLGYPIAKPSVYIRHIRRLAEASERSGKTVGPY